MAEVKGNKGWLVTFAGMAINLALGVLYSWSVIKQEIEKQINNGNWNWDKASLNDPYALALLVFAFTMIPAGRMLDKIGPRITSTIGGVLVGAGFIVASLSNSIAAWIIGFGLLAGGGIGMSYASATPAAVKWFPQNKTGLIAGIVVSGFGLASAYIAPLATFFLNKVGIEKTMFILGISFMLVVVLLSQILIQPPAGYVPQVKTATGTPKTPVKSVDYGWREMMKTPAFWQLWVVYFIGAGVGLMVISSATKMARAAFADTAWLAVTVLALGNAAGRVIAGMLSDAIGRRATLCIMLSFQAILIFSMLSIPPESRILILLVATFIGFNYGSNLSLFPSITKDYYGLRNFGLNYGLMFTAWGVGGLVLSRLSQMLEKATNSLSYSYIIAGSLLIVAVLITLLTRGPVQEQVSDKVKTAPAES